MPKKQYDYYFDFETTQIDLPKEFDNYHDFLKSKLPYNKPCVYSYGICYSKNYKDLTNNNLIIDDNKNIKFNYGISIFNFIETLNNINRDSTFWCNNGKGFDFHFLLPALVNYGYKPILPYEYDTDKLTLLEIEILSLEWKDRYKRIYDLGIQNKIDIDDIDNWIKKQWFLVLPMEYKIIANKNSQIYKIEIGINSIKRTNNKIKMRKITFQDNLLLFPSSIENMGKDISEYHQTKYNWDKEKANNEFNKQSISYKRINLYEDIDEFKLDGNELNYLLQDCYILYKWHELMNIYIPRNKWKLTIASTSYSYWEEIFGNKLLLIYLKNKTIKIIKSKKNKEYKNYLFKGKIYNQRKIYQELISQLLPTKWLDKICPYNQHINNHQFIFSNLYTGGLTMVNEKYRGVYVDNVSMADIKSSYPTQMKSNIKVPIGEPSLVKTNLHNFGYYELYLINDVKTDNTLPFIFDNRNEKREYLTYLTSGTKLYLNEINKDQFLKDYNVSKKDYKIKPLYYFQSIEIKFIFEEYIDYWYKLKLDAERNNNIVLKNICKLFLNSLYGKFGTKSQLITKYWLYDRWITQEIIQKSKFYIPLADSITTMARLYLVNGIGKNYDKFVYSDTDSAFMTDIDLTKNKNMIIGDNLGNWELEGNIKGQNWHGFVRRSKQYMFIDKYTNKKKVAFAGINYNKYLFDDDDLLEHEENVKIINELTFNDFFIGKKIYNQTRPVRILGHGILIDSIVKTIKPIWEYKPLSQQQNITLNDYLKIYNNFPNKFESINKISKYNKKLKNVANI